MADTKIHTRALLVWLNISTWSARKYDKRATQQTTSANGATSDAGRFNKLLLPGDADSYRQLTTLAGSIRAEHYNNTLAWSDEGWRLLPTANFTEYTDWLRKRQAEFARALDTFVDDYPSLRVQAQSRLGSLYKPEDYPDVTDIRAKFAVGLSYMPVPAEGDIRVDLASDQIAMIESDINGKRGASIETAMQDVWQRLHKVVVHAVEKLSQPDATFRDSLIENVREVCDAMRRFNVTDDPDLESMRVEVMRKIASASPETLRINPHTRQQTADAAADILNKMAAFYNTAA